jgi:hypothetical protein
MQESTRKCMKCDGDHPTWRHAQTGECVICAGDHPTWRHAQNVKN